MYSSSTPSVYGSLEPKRWSSTLASVVAGVREACPVTILLTDHRLGLDLDEPARIEQARHDGRSSPASRRRTPRGGRRPTADDVLGAG